MRKLLKQFWEASKRITCNQHGFIATTTLVAAAAVASLVSAVAVGTTSIVSAAKGTPKCPDIKAPVLPKAPNPQDSLDAANEAAATRRRSILSNGGQTNVTGGAGYVDPANVAKKNLLGA